MLILKCRFTFLRAGIIALLLCCSFAATAQISLLEPIQGADPVQDKVNENAAVLRKRGVNIASATLRQVATAEPGASLRLDLFPDTAYGITLKEQKKTPNGYVWTGSVKGHPMASYTMSVVEDSMAADLKLPGGITFSIRSASGDVHEVQEVSEDLMGKCGTTEKLNIKNAKTRKATGTTESKVAGDPQVSADSAHEIDILVAYTPQARAAAGGTAGMQALINLAVANANTAYTNSLIPLTLVLVYSYETTYNEDSADLLNDLFRLQGTTDGNMDEVHALRDGYNADMVCLMVATAKSGTCGIAFLMGSGSVSASFKQSCFAVCANNCVSNETFAHELGHNMGCSHDQGNGGAGAYPYSYGWRWNGTSAGNPQYRSVMAYAPGTRVKYFSNPNVNYDGTPTGTQTTDPSPAYNALTITNTRSTIANFEQRGVTGPTIHRAPTFLNASVSQGNNAASQVITITNGGPGTLNYTITDNVAWLSVAPGSGSLTTGASTTHSVVYNTSGLGQGNQSGTITITDPGAVNSPQTISVNLSVTGNPPPNDNFVNAQIISGGAGSTTGTTVNSTRETGEPATVGEFGGVGSRSIWYRWTSPGTGTITFNTFGSNFDTLLGAYTGSLGALTLVADNDEFPPGSQSQITFPATSGTQYQILVDGWSGANGDVTLNWNGTVPVSISSFQIE